MGEHGRLEDLSPEQQLQEIQVCVDRARVGSCEGISASVKQDEEARFASVRRAASMRVLSRVVCCRGCSGARSRSGERSGRLKRPRSGPWSFTTPSLTAPTGAPPRLLRPAPVSPCLLKPLTLHVLGGGLPFNAPAASGCSVCTSLRPREAPRSV